MFNQVLRWINFAINLFLEYFMREGKKGSLIWVIQINYLMQIQKANEQLVFNQW